MAIITLTTDFGVADHYVAVVKGVILSAAPRVTIVDVTHDVPIGGIIQAAFVLAQLPVTFPPGTVHLAVVDPTVGTARAILAARSADQFFITPDNGLLTFVQRRWGLESLHLVGPPPRLRHPISQTFHGRDVMAPAAAALASRGKLEELGPATDQMQLLDVPEPAEQDGAVVGRVIHVDHFGNCTTNLSQELVRKMVVRRPGLEVYVGERGLGPPAKVYADVPAGNPVALIGSADLLEIAVNLGSAAAALGLSIGSPVSLRYREGGTRN